MVCGTLLRQQREHHPLDPDQRFRPGLEITLVGVASGSSSSVSSKGSVSGVGTTLGPGARAVVNPFGGSPSFALQYSFNSSLRLYGMALASSCKSRSYLRPLLKSSNELVRFVEARGYW